MEDDVLDTPDTPAQGPAFTAVLAYEGVVTGDDRYVEVGGWSWPEPPFTLRVVMSDVGGHQGAVAVGIVEEVVRVPLAEVGGIRTDDVVPNGVEPQAIIARGHYDTSDTALEAARLAKAMVKRGLSVDPGGATIGIMAIDAEGNILDLSAAGSMDELADMLDTAMAAGGRVVEHWNDARIRAVTQLDTAAFEDARILAVGDVGDVNQMAINLPFSITAAASSTENMGAVMLGVDDATAAELGLADAHLTLFYFPMDRLSPEQVAGNLAEFNVAPAPLGRLWGSAVFNEPFPDRTTYTAYLAEGLAPGELRDFREVAMGVAGVVHDEQPFDAWVPHVTAGEDVVDTPHVGAEFTFDRLLVGAGPDTESEVIMLGGVRPTDDQDSSPDPDRDQDDSPTVTASAVPPHTTGTLPREAEWDGTAMEKALPTGEEPGFYARFYAYQAEERDGVALDGTAKDHWHYLHHVVEGSGSDATVGDASVVACTAIIQLLNGARGVNIVADGEDRQVVYDHVAKHLQDAGETDIPELQSEQSVTASASDHTHAGEPAPSQEDPMSATTLEAPTCEEFFDELAANVTAGAFTIPTVPAAHFQPIDFTEKTPLTMDENGHVYGHVATNDICHVGMPGCVTMPPSATSLAYFHTSVVRLDDGSDLSTGKITMKAGHADIKLDWRRAMAHYDDVTTTFADVVAWEDDFGIAVSGHARPGVTPEDIHAFRGSSPSGDWRRIGGSSELINIHMVNSPGFPVYRTEGDTLVASFAVSAPPARLLNDGALIAEQDLDHLVASIMARHSEAEALSMSMSTHREAAADFYRTKVTA